MALKHGHCFLERLQMATNHFTISHGGLGGAPRWR